MKKKHVLLSSLLMLFGGSMMHAQKAYTYVQQNGTKIDKLGTAAFDLSSSPTVEFDDEGKAVMTIGSNTVAKLPMNDGGQLVVELDKPDGVEESDLNKVTKTFTNPFATIYSPFQLSIPSGIAVNVYDPSYTSGNTIDLTEMSGIVPVETPLILQNAGTIEFDISADASSASPTGNFSGSSLAISVPTLEIGQTLYTLGHEKNDGTRYGFFPYSGTTLAAGLCYLKAATLSNVKALYFDGDNDETGIDSINNEQLTINNSSSPIYNLAGQRIATTPSGVRAASKSIVIVNGKKLVRR